MFPDDGDDVQELLRCADAAMYRAKARGSGRVETFTHELGERLTHRQQLEAELRHGLRAGELRLAFQPYYSLSTRALAGYEALVRWRHPRDGLLPPAQFLGVAEDTGMIAAIDRWVLDHACQHARSWPSHLTLSVNLSPARLRSGDLAQHASSVLADTGIEPPRLILELSERTLFDDEPEATTALAHLATVGVGLALDDFGAGYTSLGHLRRLPLSQLKIDRSLVSLLAAHDDDPSIIAALISFAHALGLSVTAEGIERPHELNHLIELGCDYGQGFLLSPPQPPARQLTH